MLLQYNANLQLTTHVRSTRQRHNRNHVHVLRTAKRIIYDIFVRYWFIIWLYEPSSLPCVMKWLLLPNRCKFYVRFVELFCESAMVHYSLMLWTKTYGRRASGVSENTSVYFQHFTHIRYVISTTPKFIYNMILLFHTLCLQLYVCCAPSHHNHVPTYRRPSSHPLSFHHLVSHVCCGVWVDGVVPMAKYAAL